MNKRLTIAGSLGLLTGMLVGVGIFAPRLIISYVEHEHPDVHIEQIAKIRLDRIEFEGVTVTRLPWLQAKFDRVTAHKDGRIEAHGGEATVTMQQASKDDTAPSGHPITVEGLRNLRIIGPDYGAVLEDVRYEEGILCFGKAAFTHPKLSGEAATGCVDKAKQEAWADAVKTHVEVPLGIPEFPNEGDVHIDKTHVWFGNEPAFIAYHVNYGPLEAVEVHGSRQGATTRIQVGELTLSHPWLSKEPLLLSRGVELIVPDDALSRTLSPIEATVNGIAFKVFLKERSVENLLTTCADWVAALPEPIKAPFLGFQWKTVHGSSNALFFAVQSAPPVFKIWDTCKADCSSQPLKALRRDFNYWIYTSKGERTYRTSGPGSRDWVPFGAMSPHLHTAAVTCEDPGFLAHRGYIPQAFENSLKDDLKQGRFLRGGSTITMQLAKNLWLYRDKTLTRKLQEVLLAIALESCFTKSEILELYLNVVEFGPDLYGIGAAVQHYFHTTPEALSPEQAFYLALLLPHPRKANPPDEAEMGRVKAFMKTLAKNGRLDEGMLAPEEPPAGDDAEWGQ